MKFTGLNKFEQTYTECSPAEDLVKFVTLD